MGYERVTSTLHVAACGSLAQAVSDVITAEALSAVLKSGIAEAFLVAVGLAARDARDINQSRVSSGPTLVRGLCRP